MYLKIINICLLTCLLPLIGFQSASFKTQQLKNTRVKNAYQTKWADLQKQLLTKKVNEKNFDIFIQVFKKEELLEVWLKNKDQSQYHLFKTYNICASSGEAGPKRKQGDMQVPEGFYNISAFNPNSNYHLSLKVNYPNKSDKLKKTASDPGGDIMIHGNCVTIGCIPIQDDPIEELYVLCVEVKNRNQTIPVHIYPFKFGSENQKKASSKAPSELLNFWKSLQKGFDYFELNRSLPNIKVNEKGDYIVSKN